MSGVSHTLIIHQVAFTSYFVKENNHYFVICTSLPYII